MGNHGQLLFEFELAVCEFPQLKLPGPVIANELGRHPQAIQKTCQEFPRGALGVMF